MQITLIEKVKLLTDSKQNALLLETATQFAAACTFVSEHIFEEAPLMSALDIHDRYYQQIRKAFRLKSQMACSVCRTVHARYEAVNTQMQKQHYRVKDETTGKWYSFSKDISWKWEPIRFSTPHASLVRGYDWSWNPKKHLISVGTLEGRIKVNYEYRSKDNRLLDPEWQQGEAQLVYHETDKHWYLHISVTKEFPDVDRESIQHVEGLDRGIVNTVTERTADKQTFYFDGANARKIRSRYDRTRASLQRKGTKGAKRVLKRISGRENRWMSDVNSQISKTLAKKQNTLFTVEDLTGISFDEKNLASRSSEGRHELRNWAFYDFETKLSYKAAMNQSMMVKVDPYATSQRCPVCGLIRKESRDHEHHMYVCPACGAVFNDDEVGAMNLQYLGERYLEGEEDPTFRE